MPVLVLAGDEDFLLGRRVAELKAKLVSPDWEAFNFVRLVNPDLATITDAMASLPFGEGNKMVLIDRSELFTRKKSSAADDAPTKSSQKHLDDFEAALTNVPENTYIVFACPFNFDKSLKTSKIVKAVLEPELFEKPKFYPGSLNTGLETWCRREAKQYHATIEDDAIHYLIDSTEANLRMVAQEIEKAATFLLPETHITLATVKKLSAYHSHVFTLIDSWCFGHKAKTIASLNELLTRQSGIPIIAALQTTLSRFVDTKSRAENILKGQGGAGIKRREVPIADLARRIAGETKAWPMLVESDLKKTKNHSLSWLIDKRVRLCELENLVKTGQMSDQHALVCFLLG